MPEDPITRSMAYGNAAIIAHIFRELADTGIMPEQAVFHVLQRAELWLLQKQTEISAGGLGHVKAIGQIFQEISHAPA